MKGAAGEDGGLLFVWEERRRFGASLPVFLALALLAHGATFFLFRVVYPERVTIPPPTPPVTLLTPETVEAQALFRWIEAEDPALVATASSAAPAAWREVPYRPSFEAIRTAPRTVPSSPAAVQFPPARSPLEIIRSADPTPPVLPAESEKRPTRLLFGGALASRSLQEETAVALPDRSPAPLEPAQFLIGVNDRGEVRFTFLQKSSGHDDADAQIAARLAAVAFAPAPEAITWGMATVSWGDDAYAPAAAQPPLSAP